MASADLQRKCRSRAFLRSIGKPEAMTARPTEVTRWLVLPLLAVPLMTGCTGSHAAATPCSSLGKVNDQEVTTVGAARTWGPVVGGEHRYPGYADSDRLAV